MMMRVVCLVLLAALCASPVIGADDGWQILFDGKSFEGWQSKNGQPVAAGWDVKDGCIHRCGRGGDIVTAEQFENFEIELEWRIAPGGNSGIKYRFDGKLGPEYQVLDDEKHGNGKNPLTSAGAMYAMFACNDQKTLKPVGEFNKARIVAKGTKLQHWLNGVLVVDVDTSSEEWARAKRKSKFRGSKDYATKAGRILLQDHGDEVWYRNIRIREFRE